MAEKQNIGKITHFFNKISVAVIELSGDLKVGETIEIVTSEGPFQQKVESMQVEHESIQEAKAGDDVGMKVEQPVREGNQVFKITE